jgi:hypothetical protein
VGLIELVDLGCQDEIALRQPIDFVRPARNLHFSPSKEDVRVVALRLRKLANAVHEREGFAKVGKLTGQRKKGNMAYIIDRNQGHRLPG